MSESRVRQSKLFSKVFSSSVFHAVSPAVSAGTQQAGSRKRVEKW
jgi:hypothetical protein